MRSIRQSTVLPGSDRKHITGSYMDNYKLLEGIRAVELATFVAGPTVGRLLTHFGAEVIKVESTLAGDYFRQMGALYNMPDDEMENPLFETISIKSLNCSLAFTLFHVDTIMEFRMSAISKTVPPELTFTNTFVASL